MKNLFLIIILTFILNVQAMSDEVTQKEIKILKNLRCLVCQGQSIADSNSDFAQTIKIVVSEKIKKNNSEKEIYNFLISKYGEWIVYKPSFNKTNFLLWFFPYAVLFLGGLIIFMIIKKKSEKN
jgi:cytochrome c-type biogenesis protein CcmH